MAVLELVDDQPVARAARARTDRLRKPVRSSTRAPLRRPIAAAALAATIAVVGGTLRLWNLDAVGFNSDEAVYAGQGASIAGTGEIQEYFPIFRAHPLLFQTMISLVYQDGVTDLGARLLSVAVGMATLVVVYLLGSLLYDRRVGAIAALFMAAMPYHVVVSRQVLLDGPMTLFATITLYLIARYCTSGQPAWLYSAGGALGLTFLSKEPSILLVGSIYVFFALSPTIRVRLRDLVIATMAFLLVALPYPLSLAFAGSTGTGQSFLAWQLFRRPNHAWTFYPAVVPPAMGLLLVAVAILGVVVLRRRRSWREALLLSWIIVPFLFFELWPVKGFQYLLPLAVPMAVLAAKACVEVPAHLLHPSSRRAKGYSVALTAIVVVSLVLTSWTRIHPDSSGEFLAGSGGVPGGRETGLWIRENVPEGSTIMALGPSMANIVQFYGHRKAYGLSVSPNPLHRNPTYEPVVNPDRQIRTNELQYLVWDSFSASRSPFFSAGLLRYAERYHGRAVHTETVSVRSEDGQEVEKPVVVVYEVRP